MNSYYANLAQVKATMQSDATIDDALLLRYIRTASRRVDNLLSARRSRPYFEPYNEERQYRIDTRRINSTYNTFDMRENLLSFSVVAIDGMAVTSSTVQYPPLVTPFRQLRLTNFSRSWYTYNSDFPPFFVSITGVWGYNDDYDNAWLATSTLNGNITDSANTIDVAVGDGTSFSPGMLLQINLEYMRVTAIALDELTVERGVNGSTASAHANGDAVNVWQATDDIVNMVARQAGALYARRGKYEVVDVAGAGIAQYPQDLLQELQAVVTEYQFK